MASAADPYAVPPGVLPLVAAVAVDLVFVVGVLQEDGGPGRSPWLAVPAVLVALVLPLLLLVVVVVALTGPAAGARRVGRWQAAAIAVAGLGVALYLSPWGRAGVAAVLES